MSSWSERTARHAASIVGTRNGSVNTKDAIVVYTKQIGDCLK